MGEIVHWFHESLESWGIGHLFRPGQGKHRPSVNTANPMCSYKWILQPSVRKGNFNPSWKWLNTSKSTGETSKWSIHARKCRGPRCSSDLRAISRSGTPRPPCNARKLLEKNRACLTTFLVAGFSPIPKTYSSSQPIIPSNSHVGYTQCHLYHPQSSALLNPWRLAVPP